MLVSSIFTLHAGPLCTASHSLKAPPIEQHDTCCVGEDEAESTSEAPPTLGVQDHREEYRLTRLKGLMHGAA